MASYTPVTPAEIAADPTLADWRVLVYALHGDFVAPGFSAGATLVQAIAEAADAADHHPDVDLRWPGRVHVALTTHAVGGLSDADALARTISQLATEAIPQPGAVSSVSTRWTPSTAPLGGHPAIATQGRFRSTGAPGRPCGPQQMDEPRTDRAAPPRRAVPPPAADARVISALAAGGRLVSDAFARSWWILADADGNEACVCTWQDRSG